MKAVDILLALMEGTKIKLTDKGYTYICDYCQEDEVEPPHNVFTIYQIEQGSVNLYNSLLEEFYYEVAFDDLLLF